MQVGSGYIRKTEVGCCEYKRLFLGSSLKGSREFSCR